VLESVLLREPGVHGQVQSPRRKKARAAITLLVLLAATLLGSAPAQAQSARGSLRVSFTIEAPFRLQVDQAASKVMLKAPGASKTLVGSASNRLTLNAALVEVVGTGGGGIPPTNPVAGASPGAINLLIFAK